MENTRIPKLMVSYKPGGHEKQEGLRRFIDGPKQVYK